MKYKVSNWPHFVYVGGQQWAELECCVCDGNGTNGNGTPDFKFLNGVAAFRAHLRRVHAIELSEADVMEFCTTRTLATTTVQALLDGTSGDPPVEERVCRTEPVEESRSLVTGASAEEIRGDFVAMGLAPRHADTKTAAANSVEELDPVVTAATDEETDADFAAMGLAWGNSETEDVTSTEEDSGDEEWDGTQGAASASHRTEVKQGSSTGADSDDAGAQTDANITEINNPPTYAKEDSELLDPKDVNDTTENRPGFNDDSPTGADTDEMSLDGREDDDAEPTGSDAAVNEGAFRYSFYSLRTRK
ncbi:hypothetical protein BU16DRAFT_615230 [Lophium mytilinum]|uniref:BED-type domain-containing protein n=1 Tax=Lophium mytilinum TaxID=390894 RepID=A0A6A6R573_9PEZI|nr:hypothetical protein BU16DRAFT_615230 [Lophium mytilinum]